MNETDAAYQTLGAAILEEILLRAGLDAAPGDPIEVTLQFRVGRTDSGVTIDCARIADGPLQLQLRID